jgi:putative ABC transport system substrate-binding protein
MRELLPGLRHVAALYPDYIWKWEPIQTFFRGLEQQWGFRTTCLCVPAPYREDPYRQVFADIERERPDAIWAGSSPETTTYAELVVGLANAVRIPAVYWDRDFVERGGLISFGIDFGEMFGHAAHQMDMILRGRPVAEVPFYQPTKSDLSINLRTAEMLGIKMPALLLALATRVIE